MVWYFDVNKVNAAQGGGHVLFDLKTLLKAHGGTVTRSGGGTGSGTGLLTDDSYLTTAARMGVSRAWFTISWGGKYFTFQTGSSGITTNWWVRVGYTAPTTGGAEDEASTSADMQNTWGTANTGTSLWSTAATYHHHVACDDAGYGFYAFGLVNASGSPAGGLVYDPLAAASFPAADTDPCIYYAASTSNFGTASLMQGTTLTSCPRGWFKRGLGGEPAAPNALIAMPAGALFTGGYMNRGLGTNPYTGEDDRLPIMYGRTTAEVTNTGWKGAGTVMRWGGVARSNGDTMQTTGTIDRVQVESIVLPFDNVACTV